MTGTDFGTLGTPIDAFAFLNGRLTRDASLALSSLAQRVVTALVLVPSVLAALFLLPPLGWALFSLAFVLGAAYEWARLVGLTPRGALAYVGGTFLIAASLLLAVSDGFATGWAPAIALVACGGATLFWGLVAPPWLAFGSTTTQPLPMAIVGWIVLIGVWVALAELRARSPWLVLAAMAIVWIADTAAYFAGRAFGRHKLAPSISPGKTWEGVLGALLAVTVYALALAPFSRNVGYGGPWHAGALVLWIVFALSLVALSIVGDLYESMLKRHAGVKDSGALLPGHGGVLDRVDALLAAMPPAALAALFLLRPGGTS